MGYRSDVKFIINSDKKTINKIGNSISKETKCDFDGCFSIASDEKGTYLIFSCDDVKGYTGSDGYAEVDEIDDLIDKGSYDFDMNEKLHGGLCFVRIGEDDADVDRIEAGDVSKGISVCRYSEFDEIENKKELK